MRFPEFPELPKLGRCRFDRTATGCCRCFCCSRCCSRIHCLSSLSVPEQLQLHVACQCSLLALHRGIKLTALCLSGMPSNHSDHALLTMCFVHVLLTPAVCWRCTATSRSPTATTPSTKSSAPATRQDQAIRCRSRRGCRRRCFSGLLHWSMGAERLCVLAPPTSAAPLAERTPHSVAALCADWRDSVLPVEPAPGGGHSFVVHLCSACPGHAVAARRFGHAVLQRQQLRPTPWCITAAGAAVGTLHSPPRGQPGMQLLPHPWLLAADPRCACLLPHLSMQHRTAWRTLAQREPKLNVQVGACAAAAARVQ